MAGRIALLMVIALVGCSPRLVRFRGEEPPVFLPDIPQPAPLPAGAEPPRAVHRAPMVLPRPWMVEDLVGHVRLEVVVDIEGRPRQSRVVQAEITGPREGDLRRLARQTVAGWRFEPARVDGQPVSAWAVVDIPIDLASWWKAVYDAPDLPPLPDGATRARPIERTAPLLPPDWPRGHPEDGAVTVRFVVDASGDVGPIWIIDSTGERILDLTAIEAVRQWRYAPAYITPDRPVPSQVQIRMIFKYR